MAFEGKAGVADARECDVFRVPYVAVMDMDVDGQILVTPPVAVFKVLSPRDRLQRMMVGVAGLSERMNWQSM